MYVSTMTTEDPNWLKASCDGRTGLVPFNYVEESSETLEAPLHDAAKRGNEPFLAECLTAGVSVNGLDRAGNTALFWAAHAGHTACVRLLLQRPSIHIDVQNKLGDTALHAASWKCRPECVSLLLDAGADVHLVNNEGKTALQLTGDPLVASFLRKHVQAGHVGGRGDDDEYLDHSDAEDSD